MDEQILDIVTDQGIPFRVVYGYRRYTTGKLSVIPVVAFYDRRYDFGEHGQFVADYNRETILEHYKGYGLALNGESNDWTLDSTTMHVLMTWLRHMISMEER